MSSLPALEKSILRTLAYYDIHDFPLKPEEIWRWLNVGDDAGSLVQDARVDQVELALQELHAQGKVGREGAYVTLPGRQNLVSVRGKRLLENQKKWRRANSLAKFMQIVPFVKMVAVVNTLAINNARPESDIDVLIVTSPGQIWSARMMVTGIVSMLGYRRHGDKIANRVCLSFYITSNALDLEPLKAEPDDPHFAYWASQAVPLLNEDGMYEKFVAANNWVTKFLPHAWDWDWKPKIVQQQPGLLPIKQLYQVAFSSPIGVWLNQMARDRQLKKMEKNTESKLKEPTTDVIISDDVLKFHEADRRKEYNQKYRARLAELGLNN